MLGLHQSMQRHMHIQAFMKLIPEGNDRFEETWLCVSLNDYTKIKLVSDSVGYISADSPTPRAEHLAHINRT